MQVFNRIFVASSAVLGAVLLGASLMLVWESARSVEISTSIVEASLDFTLASDSERILATIAIVAFIVGCLMLLFMQLVPQRHNGVRRDDTRLDDVQRRIHAVENQLAQERERRYGEREVAVASREPPVSGREAVQGRSETEPRRTPRRWHILPGR
jgi:hypothetical protein